MLISRVLEMRDWKAGKKVNLLLEATAALLQLAQWQTAQTFDAPLVLAQRCRPSALGASRTPWMIG
jgi:hypothetical protein